MILKSSTVDLFLTRILRPIITSCITLYLYNVHVQQKEVSVGCKCEMRALSHCIHLLRWDALLQANTLNRIYDQTAHEPLYTKFSRSIFIWRVFFRAFRIAYSLWWWICSEHFLGEQASFSCVESVCPCPLKFVCHLNGIC